MPHEPQNVESRPITTGWHVVLIVLLSGSFEALFFRHGINLYDEGWPLYAAQQIQAGDVLYRDIFFPFPPGHVLAAWIAMRLAPPGVLVARVFYSGFTVAGCLGIYLLGRRLMPPSFALLGACVLAVAAPRSHLAHNLFGYRYVIFSILALLCFSQWLRTGRERWMLAAGAATGLALVFRWTPAFAVSCGVFVGTITANLPWRSRLWGFTVFLGGVALVALPVLIWFAPSGDLGILWREWVTRQMQMTSMQATPWPKFTIPTELSRDAITECFVGAEFRLAALLSIGYGVALLLRMLRSWRNRQPFEHTLLLAAVVWGAVFFVRVFGRGDEDHFDSAIPPACLLMVHLVSLVFGAVCRTGTERRGCRSAELATIVGIVAAWVFLLGSDRYLSPARRGVIPIHSLGGNVYHYLQRSARTLDTKVRLVRQWTQPDDAILDLTWSPLLYVLAKREGAGYLNVVTPGTFLSDHEEREFVEQLRRSPPAVVIWPGRPFDYQMSRTIDRYAPQVAAWVQEHYREAWPLGRWPSDEGLLLRPRTERGSKD